MTLLDQYEQQYASLIAETTALIGRLHLHSGVEHRELCNKIDTNLNEAQELLEQQNLEVHELNATQRTSYTNKLNCAQVELKRLQKEYNSLKIKHSIPLAQSPLGMGDGGDASDFYDDGSINTDQRQRLLENSERIERTGNRLNEGYRIAIETEELGAQVLNDLNHQRESIQRGRARLRETNAELGRASRTLNTMLLRAMREKVVLYTVGVFFVVAVGVSLYLTFSSSTPTA